MKVCTRLPRASLTILGGTILASLMTSCASSQLFVESNPPGAEVSWVGMGNTRQKLGNTPLILTKANVPGLFSDQVQLTVSKDGYHGESFLIPPASGSIQGRVGATLQEDPVSKACQDSVSSIIEATEAVAQTQRLIYRKEYAEAERSLSQLTIKYPAVPVFYSLLGNVRYIQKDLSKALESYERAIALQPQNQETQRMIEKIKGIRGGSERSN